MSGTAIRMGIAQAPGARVRAWLRFVIIASLVGVLWAGWWLYNRAFTIDRYYQLPPGEPLVTSEGFRIRPLSLTRVAQLPAKSEYADPTPAIPGAEWVIVSLQIEAPDPIGDDICTFDLVGRGGRVWEDTEKPYLDDEIGCSDLGAGETRVTRVAYQVPSADIDTLYGISTERYDGSPDQVSRPG